MANFANLKAAINSVIKANGQREITGEVMNQVLTAMVNSLGSNYQFAGVATPSTNPGTPDQNVFYMATQAGTYTNFSAIVLQAGISILLWDGSWSSETFFTVDSVPTAGSNNFITSGAVFDKMKLDGGAYDVTAHNNNATFADLSALLNSENLNTLIPVAIRHGGMSIKFVQTSDNKYVQYRLMATSFTTTETDWQGVDDLPTYNSKNLVKSGGVKKVFDFSLNHIAKIENITSVNQEITSTERLFIYAIKRTGVSSTSVRRYYDVYPIEANKLYSANALNTVSNVDFWQILLLDSNKDYISGIGVDDNPNTFYNVAVLAEDSNVSYVAIMRNDQTDASDTSLYFLGSNRQLIDSEQLETAIENIPIASDENNGLLTSEYYEYITNGEKKETVYENVTLDSIISGVGHNNAIDTSGSFSNWKMAVYPVTRGNYKINAPDETGNYNDNPNYGRILLLADDKSTCIEMISVSVTGILALSNYELEITNPNVSYIAIANQRSTENLTSLIAETVSVLKYVTEAPIDNKKYVRRNEEWEQADSKSQLNFACAGDSITAGYLVGGKNNSWAGLLNNMLNFKSYHNVAVSGARYAYEDFNGVTPQEYGTDGFAGMGNDTDQRKANNNAPNQIRELISEVTNNLYPVPDVLVLAFGTNDVTVSDGDVTNAINATSIPTNLYTLTASLRWCLETISVTYPNCKIYVMLPIQRSYTKYGITGGDNSVTDMRTRVEQIKKVAEEFSAQVIDMYHNCGIHGCLEPNTNGENLSDGLHPNAHGAQVMADFVKQIMLSL